MRPGLVLVVGDITVFSWWDDAVLYAQRAAARTGRRHVVRRWHERRWAVSEVGAC